MSLRDSDGVMISPCDTLFSLLLFFPVLRFDQPRAVRRAFEATSVEPQEEGQMSSLSVESSHSETKGEFALRASRRGAGGTGELMFELIETWLERCLSQCL